MKPWRLFAWGIAWMLLLAGPPTARAGQIPGLPVPLPPGREGLLHLGIENDFLGRGTKFDDHRTEQLALDFRVGEHWLVVIDQSLLTDVGPRRDVADPGQEGRLDEWSLALARRWQGAAGRLMLGAGLRGTGERYGAEIQNGFHRIFNAGIVALPYLPGETDAIGWLALDREWMREVGDRWQGGAWLSAAGELSSGGRGDANVGGFGLLRTRAIEFRIGLRNEWREGAYDDVVRSSTAASERGLFATFGLALGPVDLENSQRLDGGEAYGRVTLRASPASDTPEPQGRLAFAYGVRLPRTAAHVAVAWALSDVKPAAARTALTLGYLSGETPAEETFDIFRSERQLTAGLEWLGSQRAGWVRPLADVGVGWRREAVYGMLAHAGSRSDPVDRAVITAGAGLETRMGTLAGLGSLALRLSTDGWLPLGEATVDFAERSWRVQAPGAGFTISIGLVSRS